jgi:RNA polymerase sigma-B factor
VLDALDAAQAYRTTSTDTPEGSIAADHAGRRGEPERALSIEERVMLTELLDALPERERQIIHLRFFEDLSQSEIAARIGMSQVHVSRLLRRTLRSLHEAHVEV